MLYLVVRFLLRPLFHVVLRMHVTGRENVPATGPVILASNHLSFIDSMVIPLSAPRRVHYLAKAEYFTGRGVKGLMSKAFFRGMGQIPVDRAGGEASERALRTAMSSRAAIEQAKGILMLLTSCGEQVAFELLAHISSNSHRKVRDVAVAIVESAAGHAGLPEDIQVLIRDVCPPRPHH